MLTFPHKRWSGTHTKQKHFWRKACAHRTLTQVGDPTLNWMQGPTLNLVMGPISSRRPVTKPALTWGSEGGMRLSPIPTSPFTQVFFQESCQQQYTYTRCINSLRQLGASTRLVRQLGASTRCVNSLHQPVCINSVHQLGASGIHRQHQRKGCSVDPNARLQRFHQCQVTAYTPGPGYIAYLMPSCVQIQLRSHACRNERS